MLQIGGCCFLFFPVSHRNTECYRNNAEPFVCNAEPFARNTECYLGNAYKLLLTPRYRVKRIPTACRGQGGDWQINLSYITLWQRFCTGRIAFRLGRHDAEREVKLTAGDNTQCYVTYKA